MRIFLPVVLFAIFLMRFDSMAQSNNDGYIRTAASFLQISPDAGATALGSTGAATSPDAYAAYWNIAKVVFARSEDKRNSLSLGFTPLLANIKSKVSNSYLSGLFNLGSGKVFTTSIQYFTTGNVILTDETGNSLGNFTPNEYALSMGYAQAFGPKWSIGIGISYIQSHLLSIGAGFTGGQNNAGSAFSTNAGIYYRNQSNPDGKWAIGFMLSNIGTKLYFEDVGENQAYFLPMNLRLGTQYSLSPDDKTVFRFSLDLNKLLVPSPPEKDSQGNIVSGKDPNISTFKALYQSFYDAPGGFVEELKEIQGGFGFEWLIDGKYTLRSGIQYQNPDKGQHRFLSAGIGYKVEDFNFDLGYLISYDRRMNQTRNSTFVTGVSWAF